MLNVITADRYASGMTFDEYVNAIGSEENLKREGTAGGVRQDNSYVFRAGYENTKLSDAQLDAVRWLAEQPGGPAKVLIISEDWSSDCQREVPSVARMAEAGGMELRIFDRDGQKFGAAQTPSLDEAPDSNADIMLQFLNHKNGETYQSIPVVAFFTEDLEHLYTFIEYAAIYQKERLVVSHIRSARPNESAQETLIRSNKEFGELRAGPFWKIWTSAAVDEMVTALQRRLVLGAV